MKTTMMRSRLDVKDPRCLSPAMARTNTGPCPEDDSRRVAAREEHGRYLERAPSPDELDELERRAIRGDVRSIWQFAPGRYSFAHNKGVGTLER